MGDKQCAHYWIIGKGNVGTCKKCGAVQDFDALLRADARHRYDKLRKNMLIARELNRQQRMKGELEDVNASRRY